MKKILLIAGALLVLTAPAAMSAEIGLAWTNCAAGGGLLNDAFNCATNSGAHIMVASFINDADMPQFNGDAGIVDIQVANPTVDAWWNFAAGCRAGRLTGNFDFSGGPLGCDAGAYDGSTLGPTGAISVGLTSPNRMRVKTVVAMPDVSPLTAGTNYAVFKLTIGNQATVGTTCPGCTDAACIVFNQLLLTQPAGVGDYIIDSGPQQYVTWKGGVIPGTCPAATPTRKATWGTVKALYR